MSSKSEKIASSLLWEAIEATRQRADVNVMAPTYPEPLRSKPLPPVSSRRQCVAITKAGKRCRGRARDGVDYCIFHDPEMTAEKRKQIASKGGRSHHKLSRLPDGYLRKLTSKSAVGEAMDRLYREVRLGVIPPQQGKILLDVLSRILETQFNGKSNGRSKAAKIQPKLRDYLTRAERRAWRQAGIEPISDEPAREKQQLIPISEGKPAEDSQRSDDAAEQSKESPRVKLLLTNVS